MGEALGGPSTCFKSYTVLLMTDLVETYLYGLGENDTDATI